MGSNTTTQTVTINDMNGTIMVSSIEDQQFEVEYVLIEKFIEKKNYQKNYRKNYKKKLSKKLSKIL
jgi:hypothetical protein